MTKVIFFVPISTNFYINNFYNKYGENMNQIKTNNYLTLYEQEKKLRTSISKLTHEIKNPLAVCNGYLEMMKDKDTSSKEKYLNIVREEIQRTLSVINDFSFFSKEKTLDLEELDLSLLLEDVVNTIKPLINKDKGKIILISKEELYLLGDYNRLKQAFINIIKNSIEAKGNSKLQITIKITNHNNSYQITIKDNGIGMNKEELSHLFEEYYTTKQMGTGLGTAYTKEIIELHQGHINYSSHKNIGTTVKISLPKEKKS